MIDGARQTQSRQSQAVDTGAPPARFPPPSAGSGAGGARPGRRAQGARSDQAGAGPGRPPGGAAAGVVLRLHAAPPAACRQRHGPGSGHHARPGRSAAGLHFAAGAVGGRLGPVRPVSGWRGRRGGLRGPRDHRAAHAPGGTGAGGSARHRARLGGSRRPGREPSAAAGRPRGHGRCRRHGRRRVGARRRPSAGGAPALPVRGLASVLQGDGLLRRGRRRRVAPDPRFACRPTSPWPAPSPNAGASSRPAAAAATVAPGRRGAWQASGDRWRPWPAN